MPSSARNSLSRHQKHPPAKVAIGMLSGFSVMRSFPCESKTPPVFASENLYRLNTPIVKHMVKAAMIRILNMSLISVIVGFTYSVIR